MMSSLHETQIDGWPFKRESCLMLFVGVTGHFEFLFSRGPGIRIE